LHHHIQAPAKFQDNGDGISVTGHVDEIPKFINIHFHISLTLKVAVRLKAHEHRCCLILWAEGGHEFQGEIRPISEGHDSSPHFLSHCTFGKYRRTSRLEK
jgi:hypothetical protein